MLPDLENSEPDDEIMAERQNSTRSCPGSITATLSRRPQFPRRSLKEFSTGRNLQPLVHRATAGLERIAEDPIVVVIDDNQPVAPPRPSRRSRGSLERMSSMQRAQQNDQLSPAASEQTVTDMIEDALHRHYYSIAYGLVILAYLIGFSLYLYFRLLSLLVPDRSFHHPSCLEKVGRRVGKDGFHYGVSIAAFAAIALFQLICFFGLTISENWTVCRSLPDDPQTIQRRQLAADVRALIGKTMYRVFLCYAICSFINCTIIVYMVGIQDSLGDTVSTIFLYVFDAIVILYFIAFPLTTVIYHPHVHCFNKSTPRVVPPLVTSSKEPRSQSSTLESTISGLEEYVQSPRRIPRTTTVV